MSISFSFLRVIIGNTFTLTFSEDGRQFCHFGSADLGTGDNADLNVMHQTGHDMKKCLETYD